MESHCGSAEDFAKIVTLFVSRMGSKFVSVVGGITVWNVFGLSEPPTL